MSRFENPGVVLVAALVLWASAVAAAAMLDVFTRISPGAAQALMAIALLLPVAVLALDESVAAHVARLRARSVAIAFTATTVIGAALVAVMLRRHGLAFEASIAGPFALLTYFVAPVWMGLLSEAARRAAAIMRSAPARSPAARRDVPRAARTSARGAGAAGV